MILVCGIPSERPLALVRDALQRRGAEVTAVNQREFESMSIRVEIGSAGVGGTLRVNGSTIALSDVRGVYTRLMDDQILPEARNDPKRCRAFHAALNHWLEVTPARVVNRTSAMASNGSKPFQAQLIRRHGFEVPETLITNDPELVREFVEGHGGNVIYKSISGVRSIVRRVHADDLDRLDRIRWCPVQFQEAIEGTDVRVHVVGSEVFPTAAHTPAVDYRYAARDDEELALHATVLPDVIAERCIALTRALGLEFAGIDLKLTGDGRIFCFEVNPSPGFNWFETMTGQPIADAVARHLMRA